MENSNKCPECGCKNLKLNADGLVCTKCGLIISENYFSENMII
jgi:transcription initiation factor TFIIIB Brf1 subunit/transcription initiation factor TFIIB